VGQPNADTRSIEESFGSEAQALHEDMQRLWRSERCDCEEMQKMSRKEPALEETGNRQITSRES
jgi:hypothetical protein